MVCRVCKRELDSPICSFCGEDNSAYIDNDTILTSENQKVPEIPVIEENEAKEKDKNFKINYRKLIGLIGAVVLIIAAIIIVVSWCIPEKEIPVKEEKLTLFSSDMLAICIDDEWGYISSQDPSVLSIKPQFRILSEFKDEIAFVCVGDKYAMINKEGQFLTVPQYEAYASVSDNGYIAVKEDGKWGYMKKDANYVIYPKFSSASKFSEGVAAVSVNGAFGYIGEDGEYVIAPQYDMALEFSDGLAPIMTDGKWGYVNKEGVAVIEPQFEMAHAFKNGKAKVKLYSDYGVIDKDGNFVIEPQFDEIGEFDKEENAKVKIGNRYGYIDSKGEYIISPRFIDMGTFGEEKLTFASRGDGKYGFIDKESAFCIEPQFDDAGEFSLGLAPVLKDGLWGYVKEDGSFGIDPRFTEAGKFYPDGFAVVKDATGKTVVIDKSGNSILNSDISLSAVMAK